MFPAGQQTSSQNTAPIDPQIVGRTAAFITVALVLGVGMFGAIAVFLRRSQQPEPFLAYFAAGFSALMIVVSFVLPAIVKSSQLRQLAAVDGTDNRCVLAGIYLIGAILKRASLDSAAFLNLVAYVLGGPMWSLGIVAVLIVLMLVPFPSQTDFENWVDQVRRDVLQ